MLNRTVAVSLVVALFLLLPIVGAMAQAADPKKDVADIQQAWDTYQEHVIARRGDKATGLLAKPTIAYYTRMRELILTGTQEQMAKQGVLTRVTVYLMRHLLTAAEMKAMSTQKFIAWTVDKGLVDSSRGKVQITNIQVDGDKAVASIKAGASVSPPILRFAREDGQWRVDVAEMIRKIEPIMEERLKKSNISEEQLLAVMMRRHSKKPYDFEKLKQPLIR